MDLRTLKLYLDTADAGSLTKAAARNFVTPSAVSQQLKALEEELGARLLIRDKNGVTMTEAGRIVAEHARELLSRTERIAADVKALEGKVTGSLRIGSIYSVGLYLLSPYVSEFLGSFPDAHLHMSYLRFDEIARSVRSGRLHLGFVAYPRATEEVAVIPIAEDIMVLAVPPRHRLAGRDEANAADIAEEPFIAFHPETPTGTAVRRHLEAAGVHVRVVHEFDNIDTIKRAVGVGAGVALVPSETVDVERERGDLVAVPFAGGSLVRPVGILHRGPLSTAAQALVGLLTREKERPRRRR